MKNQLYYNPITNKVYWFNAHGKQLDVTENFKQTLLEWVSCGIVSTNLGEAVLQDITYKDNGHVYEVGVECISSK